MKVLLVYESIHGYGGWQTYARQIRTELLNRGHEIIDCCAKKTNKQSHDILHGSLLYFTFPPLAWWSARKFIRIVRTTRPDVIHFCMSPYAMMAAFLPEDILSRCVLTLHGTYAIRPLESRKTLPFARRFYARMPRFITVSEFTKNAVIRALEEKELVLTATHFTRHTTVMHNGIELLPYRKRTTFSQKKSIVVVGGVKSRKGILESLDACAVYRDQYGTPFEFIIVGSRRPSLYVHQVQKRIVQLHLEDCVRMTGQITDAMLEDIYAKADLYLMPSLTARSTFEGFGLGYIEANARGVPCIGPVDSGAKEAIAEGYSGYSVDARNPELIALRMHWILDEGRIDRADCRAWAEKHDIRALVSDLEKAYEEILAISPKLRVGSQLMAGMTIGTAVASSLSNLL